MGHPTKPKTPSRDRVETILFTRQEIGGWNIPAFQRGVCHNAKVRALAEELNHNGGFLPGVITFGVVGRQEYLIDGQQRREAFLLSDLQEGIAQARYKYCESEAEMGKEFVDLNGHIKNMRPDDILRGMEPYTQALKDVRAECPFVGYDCVRRADHAPVLSMSVLLRSWRISAMEVPGSSSAGSSTVAATLTTEEAWSMARFLKLAFAAWGREPEYVRLWNGCNLTLCFWLYRRLVLTPAPAIRKTKNINDALFGKCLHALSACSSYIDWLAGRRLTDRDRAPGYTRVKQLFARRLQEETGEKAILPNPPWAPSTGKKVA